MSQDLCALPATALVEAIRTKRVSALEVTDAVLARIDRVNPVVNAFVTVVADQAREAARAADAAVMRRPPSELGLLHGVPVSIKDLVLTKGIRTTFGSRAFADHVPTEDALIVQRLRAAGAIILGKTNTPELGAGGNTKNALFGPTRNPWRLSHTCGGSSGGAAVALATGMGPLAQGSDTGGSLRVPASFCGVIGFRTSPGVVPVYPTPLAWDTLSVAGPMARTVGDTALMLAAIAGPDDRAPISIPVNPAEWLEAVRTPDVRGWRVAWSADLGVTPVEPEVARVAEEAARALLDLGGALEEAHPDFAGVREIIGAPRAARMATVHAGLLPRWRDQMFPPLVRNIEQGLTLTATQWGRAEMERTALWHRVRAFFERYDLLVTPTVAVPPFPLEWDYPPEINGHPVESYTDWFLLTYAITLTGLPAISVPAGWTADGLPVGLQIVGRRRGEAAVLRAAAALEAARPWAGRRPPVT
ncbi:MAG TPA: amidase family protein [bacterium]|nr:amidase family protein [bacterium]